MEFLSPVVAQIVCSENVICCLPLVHIRLDFFMEANNIDPDQTAPLLGLYCLQYRLPNERADSK